MGTDHQGLLHFSSLAALPGLVHAVTTRGVSREAAAEALGPLRTLHQVHGSRIVAAEADGDQIPTEAVRADGLSTNHRGGPVLGVLGADCPGVLLVAPEVGALAVLHAGWRGVVAGIVPGALHLLAARYGADPEQLRVGIGPGISGPRYEVSEEVADAVAASVGPDERDTVLTPGRPGHAHADLRAAIRAQLLRRGVRAAHIETHPACTYDDPRFYSYRREGPETGRHLLLAGWRA